MAKGTKIKEQQIVLNNFKTVNTYFKPFKIPPNHLAFGMNVDFTEDGKIKQRPGTELIQSFDDVVALCVWQEVRDGVVYEHLLVRVADTLYMFSDDTQQFDSIYTGLPTDVTCGGIGYVDKFIFNIGEKVYSLQYDDSSSSYTVTEITSVGSHWQARGAFYEVFAERVWLGGDGTENVYYSAVGDPTSWDINNVIAFSGRVTALKAVGEFLFVGTDRSLYKITQTGDSSFPFKVDLLANVGVAYNGIFVLKSTTLGAILTNGRVLAFDSFIQSGSQADDSIGLPIKDVIANIKPFEFASSLNVDDKVYLSYQLNNNYYNIGTIVLNSNVLGWTFYSIPMEWTCKYKGQVYFVRDNAVYKFNDEKFTDNDDEFDTFVVTAILGGDLPEIQKNWRKLFFSTESRTKTTFKFLYTVNLSQLWRESGVQDFYGVTAELGDAILGSFILGGSWLQHAKIPLDINSNGLILKIEKASENSDFQINSLKFIFYPSYRRG